MVQLDYILMHHKLYVEPEIFDMFFNADSNLNVSFVCRFYSFRHYFCLKWYLQNPLRLYLEKTGIGQYFASSPKTWWKFLLKPRLKPFLSVPWRNTGERTASEGTHTGTKSLTWGWINAVLHLSWAASHNKSIFKRIPAEWLHQWDNSEWKWGNSWSWTVPPCATSLQECLLLSYLKRLALCLCITLKLTPLDNPRC